MSVKPIHLLIPMSGQGTRYRKAGYSEPKPLIPVNGVPMIQRLLGCFPREWPCHFVLAENHFSTRLPEILAAERPGCKIASVPAHELGPSHAVLEALRDIPDDEPVLVSYCDYGQVWDATQFERFVRGSECDACVISYRGFHAHYLSPVKYAYSRLEGERVVEVREKGNFTDDREAEFASSGGYYFRTARLLRQAIDFQRSRSLTLNGELYTSLTVQALLEMEPRAHVRVFEIQGFFQWGTPEDLRAFEFWERGYQARNRAIGRRGEVAQILMPMAGLGSRFAGLTEAPKPLIPVDGRPMFRQALETFPRAERTVLVALRDFAEPAQKACEALADARVIALEQTPEGQALSTEAGIAALHPGREVIVTSCDHGVALDSELWDEFRRAPECDAAIFTIRGYPGAARRPEAFAYVVPESAADAGRFPEVARVSVKKTVSELPSRDHLLVGSFWFKTPEILRKGIRLLKEKNRRVNGELYLDSVFELLQAEGHIVRMIPLEGYLCWGDPDSLAEALCWQEIFMGHRISRRPRFPGISPGAEGHA